MLEIFQKHVPIYRIGFCSLELELMKYGMNPKAVWGACALKWRKSEKYNSNKHENKATYSFHVEC